MTDLQRPQSCRRNPPAECGWVDPQTGPCTASPDVEFKWYDSNYTPPRDYEYYCHDHAALARARDAPKKEREL